MFRVTSILPSFQEMSESTYSSAVFRRTGPAALIAPRVWWLIFRSEFDAFDKDFVLPAIAEIVFVGEGHPFFGSNLSQVNKLIVFVDVVVLRTWFAVELGFVSIPYQILVEVGMGPTHCDLQDMMQLAQGQAARDYNPPPDRRLDFC